MTKERVRQAIFDAMQAGVTMDFGWCGRVDEPHDICFDGYVNLSKVTDTLIELLGGHAINPSSAPSDCEHQPESTLICRKCGAVDI
jgi:hypothetical protein